MTAAAARWVWANSRSANGALLVLLAIADALDAEGNCIMSIPELARKTRLSERAARNGVAEAVRLGELETVGGGSGRGNRTAYRMPRNPAGSATFEEKSATFEPETRQDLPPLNPAESATFSESPPEEPQVRATSEKSATFTTSDVLKSSTGIPMAEVKDVPAKPPRADVDRLCDHLASRIEANGSKRPAVTKKWRDACRLMLDNDGRTEQQVRAAIDWCQDDEFWRGNILSMPKLREQYDRLRMQAMRTANPARNPRQQETDDMFARALRRARTREETSDPNRNGHAGPLRQGALPPAGD